MSDPREEKLPRWAREELAQARRHAAIAERRLEEHLKTVEPTRIWFGDSENPIYVPDRFGYQRIHFTEKPGDTSYSFDDLSVGWDRERGGLEVRGGQLAIQPVVSNVIRIYNVER